jgi:hypothetical protein
MVIGKEAVLTALEEDVLDEEFDTVDVLLSSEADEVVTSVLFTVVELSLPPLLAPQAVTTATASAIGITTFNRFFALINVLSLMRFLQKCQSKFKNQLDYKRILFCYVAVKHNKLIE